jgi:hypothetical protein
MSARMPAAPKAWAFFEFKSNREGDDQGLLRFRREMVGVTGAVSNLLFTT